MREGKGDPAIAVLLVAFCVASSASLLVVDGAKGHDDEVATVLINGFTGTHEAGAAAAFEPVLYAPNRALAFGFLRVGAASLDLAVVHLPSSFPLWRATPARLGDWSRPATLTFDSSLVLADAEHGVLWRTLNVIGDTVVLLNSSNLVVRRYAKPLPAWQSFDHPSDTLVVDQNFTASSPPLVSANRRFALRLGRTFMALHMELYGGRATPVYWRHTALHETQLPEKNDTSSSTQVYGRLDGRGFFGLYLDEGSRVDVLSFDTFARNVTGVLIRRVTLDDDGNLRGYYWTGASKTWTPEYEAVSGPCELPTSCGAYGLCVVPAAGDAEPRCQCLTNNNSTSASPPCHAEETADLCISGGGGRQADFDAVRRTRVSVAYKDTLPSYSTTTNKTAVECELACAANCSCWGALYNGASGGYCHLLDFPLETLVYDADDRKLGYFKVRKPTTTTRRAVSPGAKAAATAVLSLALAGLAAAGAYKGYAAWERNKRRRREGTEQELAPGPYKDLKAMGVQL